MLIINNFYGSMFILPLQEQSDCPVTMETSVSGIFFSNCAACVTASCITICFILFVVTSSQSYKNVFAILTEKRHFVTMATGKPLKLLLNSVTSITASCCHTLVGVIGFFVALSLHFHENRFWRPFFGRKWLRGYHGNT